jgi:iron complex transport system permease protein
MRVDPLRLILSGVAVQALFFAGVALLSFLFADRAPAFVAFTVGSLNGRGWPDVLPALPAMLAGGAVAAAVARPLDVLLLDEASATSVGVRVRAARLGAAALAALLAAAAVSIAGLVAFVGLVAPNSVRLLVGPSHARLLPLSALAGAVLVVVADTAARSVAPPTELPVGALLALVGAPFLIFLASRRLA